MARVILKERKARPFWFGHPWVFSGAVDRVKGRVRDGDSVEVRDASGKLVGHGFWNARSQIRVRVVSRADEGEIGADLLRARLDRAIGLRRDNLGLPEVTEAFRVVHAEGDGLPGLIVDRIGPVLVVQLSCLGLAPYLDGLLDRLEEVFEPDGILERPSHAAKEEGLEREGGVLRGQAPAEPIEVSEHGLRYFCAPSEGQKTGFYCDQRQNRVRFAPLARGLEVLDAFSYVGGFGLRMAQEGAAHVHLLDSSGPALEMAERAAELAELSDRVSVEKANVLRALDHYRKDGRGFDVVVLDPPKFVPKRADHRRGLRLYHEVNQKAVRVLRPGGILITCSCSQHVAEADFDEMLGSVAKESGVRLQEIERGAQSADHPVLLPLDESRYLKCRVLRVWKDGAPVDHAADSGSESLR